jgi:hypothetical protein
MTYNTEQFEALTMVRRYLSVLTAQERESLHARIADYLAFREKLNAFLRSHLEQVCTESCFRSRRSACCTREGIVVFFADVVVNALVSPPGQLDAVERVLAGENRGRKCVFLSEKGCLWRVRPIVCAMFLCDSAMKTAFSLDAEAADRWEEFEARRREYTWPDKPVLFDDLEQVFIQAGCKSPLMYLNTSPGLLRVKQGVGGVRKSS